MAHSAQPEGHDSAPSQQQESPYTNFNSTEEYAKAGYGGDTFEPAVEPKEHQPDYYSTPEPPTAAPRAAPTEEEPPKSGGMKEKIKETLGPCMGGGHKTDTPHDQTGHKTDTPHDQTSADAPHKKSMFEKVKEKVSPH